MEYPKFKVTVSCMTYNQSKYITDAMNGFTMQQTDFPFVCTIVDDASTDGEQEVIRKYVEENFDFSEGSAAYSKETDYAFITYAQHKTNKNCYFAVLYLKENHYSQKKDKSPYLKEWRDGVARRRRPQTLLGPPNHSASSLAPDPHGLGAFGPCRSH